MKRIGIGTVILGIMMIPGAMGRCGAAGRKTPSQFGGGKPPDDV